MAEKYANLCLESYGIHMTLDLDAGKYSEQSLCIAMTKFRKRFIEKYSGILERVFLTVIIRGVFSGRSLLMENLTEKVDVLNINHIILGQDKGSSKETIVQDIKLVLEQYGSHGISFGLIWNHNDRNLYELQWILDRVHDERIKSIAIDNFSSDPLLYLRTKEFIMRRGLNPFFLLPNSVLTNSPELRFMRMYAEKYQKSSCTTFSKALLQFGYIVALSIDIHTSIADLLENFLLLGHPFIYRREFVAPTKIINFTITSADMDELATLSENLELEFDEDWHEFACTRMSARALSYDTPARSADAPTI